MDINRKKIMKETLVKDYKSKYSIKIQKYIKKGMFEKALIVISALAKLNYDFNQYYYDEALEQYIWEIAKSMEVTYYAPRKQNIVFFDSFGFNNRGLAQIYLQALTKKFHVTYVTYIEKKNDIPDIEKIVVESGGNIEYLRAVGYYNRCNELIKVLVRNHISTFMLYAKPEDVIPVTVLAAVNERIMRIQINLTDHAYWLGATVVDKCIEFREYGMYISSQYRKIARNRIYYLPFYPQEAREEKFQGFPFEVDNKKDRKLCFSGGSLYKTLGAEGAYYKFVDCLLSEHNDLIFWYAGNKDEYGYELKKLLEKYPERVYWTEERKDLLEILRRTDIYLNTYPIGGGLMIQYAVLAGTIPIMVKYDDNSSGVLENQDSLMIFHNNFEEARETVKKVFYEQGYREKILENICDSVPRREWFEDELVRIVANEAESYQKVISIMDVSNQRKTYYDNFYVDYLERYFFKKKNIGFLSKKPLVFARGLIGYVKSKKKI